MNNVQSIAHITDSILVSIKKLLMLDELYVIFDADIIMHINTVLSSLTGMGVGVPGGYIITGANDTWADFIGEVNDNKFQQIKSYVYIKVKLLFDPPPSSYLLDSLNRQAAELEYRMYIDAGGY